jgi:hypothetical protein
MNTTDPEVIALVRSVWYGILTTEEALAKDYITDGQRAELAAELADEE